MTIQSSLRFLYILGGSGLLCAMGTKASKTWTLPKFKVTVYPISTSGADYADHIIPGPPDFQNLRRPWIILWIPNLKFKPWLDSQVCVLSQLNRWPRCLCMIEILCTWFNGLVPATKSVVYLDFLPRKKKPRSIGVKFSFSNDLRLSGYHYNRTWYAVLLGAVKDLRNNVGKNRFLCD